MNNMVLSLWEREFDVDIIYDVYEGEEVLDVQKEAFEVFKNTIDNKDVMEIAKQGVIKYILSKNASDVIEENITNLFKFIIPTAIYVERDGKVDIMCECKFDIDHGIAIQFEKEQFKGVVTQDLVI